MCRKFFEELFNNSFPRYRANWLRNKSGFKLEFDGYCEELGIAFEHNGIQHYRCVEYFGKDRFEQLQMNDLRKIEICKEKQIKLIIIPHLFTITKLKNFKSVVKQQLLQNNICIPDVFDSIDIVEVKISRNEYCIKQLELAKKYAESYGGKLLSTNFVYSHKSLIWQCKNNHIFEKSLTGIKQGYWCRTCYFDSRKLDTSKITYEMLYNLHHTKNYSSNKISGILKISPQIIRKLLSELKIKRKLLTNIKIPYNDMYALYITENKTINEIAKNYSCTHDAVRWCLKKHLIFKYKKVLNLDIIKDLYLNKGMTVLQIAKEYDQNQNTLKQILSRNNIKK